MMGTTVIIKSNKIVIHSLRVLEIITTTWYAGQVLVAQNYHPLLLTFCLHIFFQ